MQDFQVERAAWEQEIVDTMADHVRFPWDPIPSDDESEVGPAQTEEVDDEDNEASMSTGSDHNETVFPLSEEYVVESDSSLNEPAPLNQPATLPNQPTTPPLDQLADQPARAHRTLAGVVISVKSQTSASLTPPGSGSSTRRRRTLPWLTNK
jgi:hypothetical protein